MVTAGLHPWHNVQADGVAERVGVSSVQPSGHTTRSSVVTATITQTSRQAMSRTTQYKEAVTGCAAIAWSMPGWGGTFVAETGRDSRVLERERRGGNEEAGMVRILDLLTRLFSMVCIDERVGFVPAIPAPSTI
jgi:hypothetical protein